jgi:hypothetical protein
MLKRKEHEISLTILVLKKLFWRKIKSESNVQTQGGKRIRKMNSAIQNKMNLKLFFPPLLRIIAFPCNFSTSLLFPFILSKIVRNEVTINFNSQENVSQSEVNRTQKNNNPN